MSFRCLFGMNFEDGAKQAIDERKRAGKKKKTREKKWGENGKS